jgi:MFS family permease
VTEDPGTRPDTPAGAGSQNGARARLARSFPALESPTYRWFLFAGAILTIGGFMQQTAQGWLVLELTNSPALLGLAGAVTGVPTLFLSAFAGVIADRVDRRRLLVAVYLFSAAVGLVLAALTSAGLIEYWHVLVLAFLAGLAFTVQMPAAQATVSSIVPRHALGNAIALNATQYNFLRILAPALAGLFIAAGSLALGFWVNAAAFVLVAVIVGRLAIPTDHLAGRVQAAMWRDLRDGMRFVGSNRILLILVLLPAVPALLILNYITFIPLYARDILAIGPAGLGLLSGGIGVGASIGAISLATLRPSGGSGRLVLGALGILGAALVVFAISRNVALSMVALAVMGAMQPAYYATTNTLIQILAPARLRGRILSLYTLTSIGLIPVANLVGGALAEAIGVEAVLAAGGILAVLITGLVGLGEPSLLRLRASQLSRSETAGADQGTGA